MKSGIFSIALLLLCFSFTLTSCGDDDTEIVTIDSSLPSGTLNVDRSGSFTAQNDTPTQGDIESGTDDNSTNFLRLANNFTTEQATGTVSVYLSTSEVFTASPGTGNPDLMLIGSIRSNGEQFFKLDSAIPANFTHVILWCNTAGIPFGYGPLN